MSDSASVREVHFSAVSCCQGRHLTDRQLDVVKELALGKSTSEIAESLNIAPSTVSNQVSRIFERLQCSNRVQLVAMCFAAEVLEVARWPPTLTGRRCVHLSPSLFS